MSAEEIKQPSKKERDDESDDEFDEEAKPSPLPNSQVANPPLPVQKGPQEGLNNAQPTEPKAEDAQSRE